MLRLLDFVIRNTTWWVTLSVLIALTRGVPADVGFGLLVSTGLIIMICIVFALDRLLRQSGDGPGRGPKGRARVIELPKPIKAEARKAA